MRVIISATLIASLNVLVMPSQACISPMQSCGCVHRLAAAAEMEAVAVAAVVEEADAVAVADATGPRVFTYTFRTCPRAEWRPIIEKNILPEPASAATAVQEALSKQYGQKFPVRCKANNGNTFVKLASDGEAYCAVVKDGIWCRAEQPTA
ncbi:hypothetical protein AAVH_15585 [Aphelenchoides avenae]|nr:hypothetical protein AAVH_15585 [Aphelenchus avenae]